MNPLSMKHSDKELKLLRFLAMAGIGYYLFRTMQKEGHLGNTLNNPEAARFKTREFLGVAGKLASDHLSPEAKNYFSNPIVSRQLQDIGTTLMDALLGQKGNDYEPEQD
jgi:hypothetical protein